MSAEQIGERLKRGVSRTVGLDVETIANPAIPPNILSDIFDWAEEGEPPAALSPALCSVVCAGFILLETGRSVAYSRIERPQQPAREEFDGGVVEYVEDERALLDLAGRALHGVSRIVTFMGRRFDVPVLLHRMIALGVPPPRALWAAAEENRYRMSAHFDVWDQMTLYGAASVKHGTTLRAFSVGQGFGDPKEQYGGGDVATMTPKERAFYCLGDVRATLALYRKWTTARAESYAR